MNNIYKLLLLFFLICLNSYSDLAYGSSIVNAGPDQSISCYSSATLAGSITGSVTTGKWSTYGDGTFSSITDLHAVYTPGSGDISKGYAYLGLISDDPDALCSSEFDYVTIYVNRPAPIPTLSQWGLIIFGLAVIGFGILYIRRRRAYIPV